MYLISIQIGPTKSAAKESLGERRDKRHFDQQPEERLDGSHHRLRITGENVPVKEEVTFVQEGLMVVQ